jgi:hypothetical protein
MTRQDHTFQGTDGKFHFADWGGKGPLAHFSHASGLCAGTYTPLAERLTPSWLLQRNDLKRKFRERLCGALKIPVILSRWKGRMKPQRQFSIFLRMKTSYRNDFKF